MCHGHMDTNRAIASAGGLATAARLTDLVAPQLRLKKCSPPAPNPCAYSREQGVFGSTCLLPSARPRALPQGRQASCAPNSRFSQAWTVFSVSGP